MSHAFWDQRYAATDFKYGTEPNAFLHAQAHRIPPASRVLVPGDGEGRNGVWLAEQGHQVLSVDASAVGLAKAQKLAQSRHCSIDIFAIDLNDWEPGVNRYDAVVLVFVHLPSACRQRIHRKLALSLKPGGVLLLEAFHPLQRERNSGGPKDLDMLPTLADLRQDFDGLLIEHIGTQGIDHLDEGPGHQGDAYLTRYLGQRLP